MEPLYSDPNRIPASSEFAGGIWPPAPVGQVEAPLTGPACPFRSLYRRASGKAAKKANISDPRVGFIQFDAEGIILQGKAVPRAEIRLSIMIPLVLLNLFVAAVAGTIMEYATRHDERLGIRWPDVKEILLSPTKNEACVVYDAPNYIGQVKTFSLGVRLGPEYYPLFAQSAQQYAAPLLTEGRLRNATALSLWIALGVILALFIGLIVMAVVSPTGH